jgi:hypothetical protein
MRTDQCCIVNGYQAAVQKEWEDDGTRCLEFQEGLNSAAILNEGKVVMKAVNFMEKARFLRHFTILEYE